MVSAETNRCTGGWLCLLNSDPTQPPPFQTQHAHRWLLQNTSCLFVRTFGSYWALTAEVGSQQTFSKPRFRHRILNFLDQDIAPVTSSQWQTRAFWVRMQLVVSACKFPARHTPGQGEGMYLSPDLPQLVSPDRTWIANSFWGLECSQWWMEGNNW